MRKQYRVKTTVHSRFVCVEIEEGAGHKIIAEGGDPPWIVRQPNAVERFMGITFKDKLKRAQRQAAQCITAIRHRRDDDRVTYIPR